MTCLGINNPAFSRRTSYDVVVIDEASQILQPISLGPLLLTNSKFVLVGDHNQLPPLLRARDAIAKGNIAKLSSQSVEEENVSLFERLRKAHPTTVISLKKQYRMAEDIMALANELVYKGELEFGNERTLKQELFVSNEKLNEIKKNCPASSWLQSLVNLDVRTLFVDMDSENLSHGCSVNGKTDIESKMNGKSKDAHGHTINLEELEVILQAVGVLIKAGVQTKQISILAPFRIQVQLFRERLQALSISEVSVFTTDQYQGRDNDCVFVSFVRNLRAEYPGPLLDDWRRINVAITRAKKKLVLVGSRLTLLRGSKCLKEMMKHFESRDAVVNAYYT